MIPPTRPRTHHVSALLALLCLCGCSAIAPPNEAMTAAAGAFLDAVGPEYLSYVDGDPRLDAPAKAVRRRHVEEFGKAVTSASTPSPTTTPTTGTGRTR